MGNNVNIDPSDTTTQATGAKQYELTNHLGNVLATITDKGVITSAQDYYPFGLTLASRSFTEGGSSYRYSFNGKEDDKGLKQQDYGARINRPDLGRFLSVDPLTKDYPWYTPYQFAGNMPIIAIDLDGAEPLIATNFKTIDDLKKKLSIAYSSNVFGTKTVSVSNTHNGRTMSDDLSSSEPSQEDLKKARDGTWREKASAGIQHPIIASKKSALQKIEKMSFKAKNKEKMAFGDISQSLASKTQNGTGTIENTYLHVAGQAFITILFGESTANIAGHLHERSQEALLTGVFNPKEITQAIDNYADLNNNQWGQAFGKEIMSELNISSSTMWTAEITSGVLNKLQTKLSDTMGVKFKGVYKKGDKFVKDLTNFINKNK